MRTCVSTVIVWVMFAAIGQADEFEQLTRQYREYLLERNPSSEVRQFVRFLQPDGSWKDVNYQDQTRGSWQTYTHLSRVYSMALAYNSPHAPGREKPALAGAIHKALNFWLDNDFQNPNWWYNLIGVPQIIGDIAILVQDELTPWQREIIFNKIMPRAKISMTAQNRVWVAGITLVRGILLKDRGLVEEAARAIGDEICVTTKEGVQPDFSFHQHGPQQQFGNYGLAFARCAVTWLRVLHGTPFALPEEKLEIVRNYLLEGEAWVVWKGRMDLSSCGRQLRKGSALSKGESLAEVMEQMSRLDPARAAQYQAFLKRNRPDGVNDLIGNRNFWRSDYMVHRRPDFYASVKMCSRRVTGGEIVNSENVSGYHLADGALLVYGSGLEYDDIQPVWDWQKIPGTTTLQRSNGPPRLTKRYRLDTDFAGGVSDGTNGCAAVDYTRDGVKARKAWFFIGDCIACLGAGIGSENEDPIVTTVNQCWWKGDVLVCQNGQARKVGRGEHRLKQVEWVWHDGMGYIFPNRAAVKLSLGEQRGSWRKVEEKPHIPAEEVKGDVFLITIEHGQHPKGADYCWLVLPGVAPEAMVEKARQPGIVVLANTPRLQAVRSTGNGPMQAAFYEPGNLEARNRVVVTVEQPCLLMLNEGGTKPHVTIADPTQKLTGPLRCTVAGTSKN